MSRYIATPIRELGTVVTGKTPTTSEKHYYNGEYMFITPVELHDGYNVTCSEKTITEAGLNSIASNSICGTSVLVGCIGWDMGNVAMCHKKCATNQQINAITKFKPQYNPYYTYYWLSQKKEYLFSIASVTRTPILSKGAFEEVIIPMPSRNIQDSVVDVLRLFDEKIATNKGICTELESMAKTLYDYWFTQFDFPNAEGKPYHSSGGEMVWNDQLKREIPKGWDSCKLNDYIYNVSETTSPGNHLKDLFYTPIDEIPKHSMSFFGGLDYTEANSSLQLYMENDILLGAMRVYFHRVCIAAQAGITRSTTMVLRPKEAEILPFVYELLNQDQTISFANRISVGTQQPYVNWDNALDSMAAIAPDSSVISKYCEIVNPAISIVKCLVRENYELAKLRDWLLPMLMNGQVTVE